MSSWLVLRESISDTTYTRSWGSTSAVHWFRYENTGSSPLLVTDVTVPLGKGNFGSFDYIYDISGRKNYRSDYEGKPVYANLYSKIIYNDPSASDSQSLVSTVEVTNTVSISDQGTSTQQGSWNQVSSSYNVTFRNVNVVVPAYSKAYFSVCPSGGGILTSWDNTSNTVSGSASTQYPSPIVSVDKTSILYGGAVTVSHTGNTLEYSYDGSSWTSCSAGQFTPTQSGLRFRSKIVSGVSGIGDSSWSVSSIVTVTCPKPSSLVYQPSPVILNEIAYLSCESADGCTPEIQVSVNGGTSWSGGSGSFKVVNNTCTFRIRLTRSNCISSDWVIFGENIRVKLPRPSCSVSPNPVTISLVVNINSVTTVNSATSVYQYSKNGVDWQICENPFTIDSQGYKFRTYLTLSGYEDSDPSDSSDEVVVYYEPRVMETKGFSASFNSSDLITPGETIKVSWKSFDPGYNLGLYNYFEIDLIEEGEVLETVTGSNDPFSDGSADFTVLNNWAGKNCKLRLTCCCLFDGVLYRGDSFESEIFTISGYPNPPEFYYPSGGDFTTCNESPRIIFKVSNPDFLDDTNIYNIRIDIYSPKLGSTVTYSLKNDPSLFVNKDGEAPSVIPNNSIIGFIVPKEVSDYRGSRYFRVYCTNSYLEHKTPTTVHCTFRDLRYPTSGEKLLKSLRDQYADTVQQVCIRYSKIYPDVLSSLVDQSDIIVRKQFGAHTIEVLKLIYESVINYIPALDDVIDLSTIDLTTDHLKVVASQSFDGVRGNYFNDIWYILKNML